MNLTENALKEVFASEEYRTALKARLVAGTAKASEINLARTLGMLSEEVERSIANGNIAKMDPGARRAVQDILDISTSAASGSIRRVETDTMIGVLIPKTVSPDLIRSDRGAYTDEASLPTPAVPDTGDDLMPAKKASA
jgi:hypothetical protein